MQRRAFFTAAIAAIAGLTAKIFSPKEVTFTISDQGFIGRHYELEAFTLGPDFTSLPDSIIIGPAYEISYPRLSAAGDVKRQEYEMYVRCCEQRNLTPVSYETYIS